MSSPKPPFSPQCEAEARYSEYVSKMTFNNIDVLDDAFK
jgi:hypothetical protein